MSERDLLLLALMDEVRADGAASQAQTIESLAYGNLKFEDPLLQRSTMAEAARKIARDER